MTGDNTIVAIDLMVEHRTSSGVVRALEPLSMTVEGLRLSTVSDLASSPLKAKCSGSRRNRMSCSMHCS